MASLRHYFNTYNCVSTPVNPSSRLPMPSYERLSSEPTGRTTATLYRNEVISKGESHAASGGGAVSGDEDAGTIPPSSVSPFEDMDNNIIQQENKFNMQEVFSRGGECTASFDKDFYSELTKLKQQNIVHLQDLENQLRSKKYKLNNDETVQNRNPLFVLDMPCYCDDENSQNNINNGSRTITKKVQDESEDITSSIEEDLGMFDGVTDDDEDINDHLLMVPRSASKRSIRVQSAPIIIGDKNSKPKSSFVKKKFEPTVIKPFKMTLRDEEKLKEKALLNDLVNKSKNAENEWDEENTNSELITEEKYIFKAKPVPNHVKKNLLKKMMEEHPQRFSKFGANLEQNNNDNKLKRTQSVPINLNEEGQFKAKPFPKSIFTDFAYEQIREDQRYRTIRKEMRQKALLNSAKLPPRMQEVRDKMSMESPNKKNKTTASSKEPKIITKQSIVPDFDKSYQKFLKNLQQKKMSKPTTVIQPFSFDDDIDYYKTKPKSNPEMSSPSKTNLLSIIMNQKNKPKNSKRFSGSMPNLSSEHTEAVLQSTTNTTSHLRRAFNAKKKQIYDKNEILEKRKVLTNEMRQIEMRENHPAWQRLRFEVVDHSEIEAKKSQRLLETRERARDYKLDLEKMMIRVQNQPTLFERQSAMSAKQQVEKRYRQLLQKEGVSEDEISKLISAIEEENYSRKSSLKSH